MHTRQGAVDLVVGAIAARGGAYLYDVDAIVENLHYAAEGWNLDKLTAKAVWHIIAAHSRKPS